jgi:nucleoside 2-deoxyribosyltransferase
VKVVVCGSYGDLERFYKVLTACQEKYGASNVFPDKKHMEKSIPCIFAHHVVAKETDESISNRSKLMQSYFTHIDCADLIIIVNEKNGSEHYGVGTTIELGYAFAKGKSIFFTRPPTNSNILSLMKTVNSSANVLYA